MQISDANYIQDSARTRAPRNDGLRAVLLAPLLLFLLSAVPSHAQFNASLRGTVTDPSGAVIPGATLTLTNTATNEKQVRTSNGVGVYSFDALPPGAFTLVVEKGGYQTKNFDNLQILPEQANPLNVQLQIANVAQTVTVDA
jgi:hypothetical protein